MQFEKDDCQDRKQIYYSLTDIPEYFNYNFTFEYNREIIHQEKIYSFLSSMKIYSGIIDSSLSVYKSIKYTSKYIINLFYLSKICYLFSDIMKKIIFKQLTYCSISLNFHNPTKQVINCSGQLKFPKNILQITDKFV